MSIASKKYTENTKIIQQNNCKSYFYDLANEYLAVILSHLNESDQITFTNMIPSFSDRFTNKHEVTDVLNLMLYIKYPQFGYIFSKLDLKSVNYNLLYIDKILSKINYDDIIEAMNKGISFTVDIEDSLGFLNKLYETLIKIHHKEVLAYIIYKDVINIMNLYTILSNLKKYYIDRYNNLFKTNEFEKIYDYYMFLDEFYDSYIIVVLLNIHKNISSNIKFELISMVPSYWNYSVVRKLMKKIGNYSGTVHSEFTYRLKYMF